MKRSGRKNRTAEDSLENTLSCVPKVQGESRISQANGRRCKLALCFFVFTEQTVLGLPVFYCNLLKEGCKYAC